MLSKQLSGLFRSGRRSLAHFSRCLNLASELSELSYFNSPGLKPLQYETFGECLDKSVDRWPERLCVISKPENISLTYSQVSQEVERLAAGLLEIGLQPGDRIGICAPNSSKWLISMMAAMKVGLITVAINAAFQKRELEFCLKKVGVKALFTPSSFKTQEYYKMLCDIVPEIKTSRPGHIQSSNLPQLKSVITLDNLELNGTFKFKDVSKMGSQQSLKNVTVRADAGCLVLFTSGTTGQPKAALHSHFSYANNCWEAGIKCEFSEKHHKICFQTPLFHAFGLIVTIAGIRHGASIVFPSPIYNLEHSLNAIHSERCTTLIGTPTMYIDLVNKQKTLNFPLSSPEVAITGGAPCSTHLFNEIRKYLGARSVKSMYGMTELSAAFLSVPGEGIYEATETVGKLMGHLEAKIVDSDGNVVPKGTLGELCVRGYTTMLEYWDDKEKTQNIVGSDNWLNTGDQFLLEDNGYAKIAGRLKDMIIRGGENIFPREIEDFLNSHPDVIETYVFGVKDDRLGEEICAALRLREGADFSYKQLKQFCDGNIAHFKVPRHLKVLEKFPVTALGKVQKYRLREMVESGQI